MSVSNRKKDCFFLKNNIKHVDFRDVHILQKFINAHGKIVPRTKSGVCAKYQRKLENAIKRARYMALLPYVK